ncbi:MAG: glycosyltransferase [Verrucomicrobiae bacterium]|nr:glycosyltransferase [Verrucomicrobiae bacterium]
MNRVVFGAANHWTSPFQVGSHAWARLFAANGWSVFYASDPLTPWHFLDASARAAAAARFALWRRPFHEEGVQAWAPFSLVAPRPSPVLRSAWALQNWSRFAWPPPVAKAISQGFAAPDLLWLDSVRHAAWGERLRPARVVLRVADWSAGFGAATAASLDLERRLVAEADLVVASAATLAERLRARRGGRPLAVIRNGVDLDFWQETVPEPPEYREIPCPRAVYVGAIDAWLDAERIGRLAAALPAWSFVMIGPARRALPPARPNLHWLGARPRAQARAYVRHAQAGIIPFLRNELVDHVCPIKLYEYMACGLPVVATRWAELEAMASPARLAANDDEWIAAFNELGVACRSLPRERETTYAVANSWPSRWPEFTSAATLSMR